MSSPARQQVYRQHCVRLLQLLDVRLLRQESARWPCSDGAVGCCYSRTGRRILAPDEHAALVDRIGAAITEAGLWETLSTDWVVLDCELMPWNLKATSLLTEQYASVSVAGRIATAHAHEALARACGRGLPLEAERDRVADLRTDLDAYTKAYGRYCWPVNGLDDVRLAPFHLLASEGGVHADRDHHWHLATLKNLAEADPGLFMPTECLSVDLFDEASTQAAKDWWVERTEAGSEGFVVKPETFLARSGKSLVQPAVKCRGREYLRIIYGPDYTRPDHLARLKARGLRRKRTLAQLEFALGIEALERFVRREPLHRVHECVFGVLALESEAVDPRL